MRIADDITYHDLGIVQPDGGREVGEKLIDVWNWGKSTFETIRFELSHIP